MYNSYLKNGVIIVPNVIAEGTDAKILYKGLLYNSGAESVYMHVGYGPEWRQTTDIQMKKTTNGFEAAMPVAEYDKLNIAFKDSANNWDNNSGSNYTFNVEAR